MGSSISILNFFEIFPFKKSVVFHIPLHELHFSPGGAKVQKIFQRKICISKLCISSAVHPRASVFEEYRLSSSIYLHFS